MSGRRVVVTGMGAVTPIGNDVETFWAAVKEGKTGFSPITAFDTSEYKVKLAAEVKDYDPEQSMDKKSAKRMERFARFAVTAAGEAIRNAGLDLEKEDPYRCGCAVGSGVGSLQAIEREYGRLLEKGPAKVGPLLVPLMISNMAAGNVSIIYGLKGKNINVVTACASGTHSIGEAFRSVQYGEADVMLAGGTEAAISPLGIAGFTALTALSTSEDPAACSLPFDARRNGFVMGEGAGVVVLEEMEHAKARGANILAEVAGYGSSADAFHITSPAEDGEGAAMAMLAALKDAGLAPEELGYINAHGTGTHYNDLFETRAIKRAFGEHAYKLRINSTKSMVGHLLGAAGAVEFITCVKELQEGFLHATVGLEETEEEMDLDYCREAYHGDVRYALSNSLGFGGHNASLLVRKYEG
ncbi:MAG: beta-ketoacyl-ACP synthase II [Lachnospiraceae bacterium]|nr:beta-ketoacyl-ACP synthase II [Lachnospiraceae bacterium]